MNRRRLSYRIIIKYKDKLLFLKGIINYRENFNNILNIDLHNVSIIQIIYIKNILYIYSKKRGGNLA